MNIPAQEEISKADKETRINIEYFLIGVIACLSYMMVRMWKRVKDRRIKV